MEAPEAGADTKQASNTPGEEGTASVAAVEADTPDGTEDQQEKDAATTATQVSAASSLSGDPAAASDPPVPPPPEEEGQVKGVEQDTTQAAGEAATEEASGGYRGGDRSSHEGTTKAENNEAEEQQQLSSSQANEQSLPTLDLPDSSNKGEVAAAAVEVASVKTRQSNMSRILPDSLAQEIGDRAFPLALTTEHGDNKQEGEEEEEEGEGKKGKEENGEGEEKEQRDKGGSRRGVFCAAFHALAAEAVWAGLNGSERVEKPPESVWDSRGGDRWGTAAFFAEQIGEREEEAAPGLPQQAKILMRQADGGVGIGCVEGGGGCSGPLSGSSARHATARAMCMAAVSSRRGFLKQATEEAAKEVCAESSNRSPQLFSLRV